MHPPQNVCDDKEACGFATAEGLQGCHECAQKCEDACTISSELTSQCTDQCVVIACNDAHHSKYVCEDACDQFIEDLPCGKECSGDLECAAIIDSFLNSQCCTDYSCHPADCCPDPSEIGRSDFLLPGSNFNSYFAGALHPQMQRVQHFPNVSTFPPLDSTSSTPQLVPTQVVDPSPSQFTQPHLSQGISSPNFTGLPPPVSLDTPPHQEACKWAGCNAVFRSMSELVGHVNLEHLRSAPSAPLSSQTSSTSPANGESVFGSCLDGHQGCNHPFFDGPSCMWGDCNLFPNGQPAPGPSNGDELALVEALSNHLMRDHLGISKRQLCPIEDLFTHGVLEPSATPSPISAHSPSSSTLKSTLGTAPLSPSPEHDCASSASHPCRWKDCGQNFVTCEDLTDHIAAVHVGGGRAHYDCHWEGCSRNGDHGFASKQKISRHMQSHTGHRPFQCNVCQQNFSEAATLAQHMRRHTQEKPYSCDFPGCGKAFAIAGALTIHKRTHNGSKPFKCSYCDRAFSESSNLSKHLRTHTGAKPYTCADPSCNKSFARPDQLARHSNIHKRKPAADRAASAELVPS
ncbi:uncharacterized protein BXZ73DRAFT_45159 [Epithele typhae]|uniref:uncharacterized protein n=1 Tax=Epithele typhae TaxID=378194 RepID=UPI0020073EE6|nr:uncharacterized protein BXZ73DRAFT_45159 [Epithele typhae]KAH9935901.1 hypothetical protein BXZ73DRAFT_45159 [Epithele typhae]